MQPSRSRLLLKLDAARREAADARTERDKAKAALAGAIATVRQLTHLPPVTPGSSLPAAFEPLPDVVGVAKPSLPARLRAALALLRRP